MNPMMINMIAKMQQNPAEFLSGRGFNIPQNLNNPTEILQYLMNTGQVSQQKYNNAMSIMKQFGQTAQSQK